ncbi:MAG: S-layer protein, partial [Pirellulaceae bacterium]|nr:S-layer protein [Pirellulaceae bacterium]
MRFEHGVALPGRSMAFMVLLLVSMAGNLVAEESLAILPADFTLTGTGARHRLLVQRVIDGEYSGEAAKVTFSSDNPDVVVIRNGVAVSVGDGTAQVKAVSGQRSTITRVRVVKAGQVIPRSFRNHVLPVFAKSGCNSGSCHGALAGKGGFKLSLRGYDAET